VEESPVKKLLGATSALVLAASGLLVAISPAAGDDDPPVQHGTTTDGVWSNKNPLLKRFGREQVKLNDRDNGPYHIEHVLEVQYRLSWAGVLDKNPTGRFGYATRSAVKKFQHKNDLHANGKVSGKTWAKLIKQTIRGRGAVPKVCKTSGWHACYDRSRHQVTLWKNGDIYNSWLVRGGAYSTPTRLGTNKVFQRDKDHYSGLFDSAPMPFSQFFDGGQALHGSRFMTDPFVEHSHGCINMYVEDARVLWKLTSKKELWVTVYGNWDKGSPALKVLAKD